MRKVYVFADDRNCFVEAFFQKANKKIKKKFQYQLDYIKDERNVFAEPHVKHFSIEKYRQLYELRIKAAGTMVRVIFYEHAGEVVLLHAFYKRGKKDTEKALEYALKVLYAISDGNGAVREPFRKELVL